jgi:hypothetical protein
LFSGLFKKPCLKCELKQGIIDDLEHKIDILEADVEFYKTLCYEYERELVFMKKVNKKSNKGLIKRRRTENNPFKLVKINRELRDG